MQIIAEDSDSESHRKEDPYLSPETFACAETSKCTPPRALMGSLLRTGFHPSRGTERSLREEAGLSIPEHPSNINPLVHLYWQEE